MSSLKLSFVIEAIDRATARVTAVNKAIDKITEPARRVRAAFNSLVNEGGFRRLGDQLGEVGRRFGGVRDAVGGIRNALFGAAAAGGALFFSMSRITGRMDKLVDDAKMLNVPLEWLQGIGQAAEQSGGSVEGMTDALRFLSRNMAEAIAGGKEQVQWFERVGIPLERLKKMSLPQVFDQISDKFNQVGDAGHNAQKKIAVTQALMGRGGFEMVQLLNKGSKGIGEIVTALRKAGTIVDANTAESLADFNDTLAMLRGNLFATIAVIARSALPVFERITAAVMDWSKGNRDLMATRVADYVARITQRLPSIINGLGQLASGIGAVISVLDTVAQAMGGWETVIVLVAAALVLKLIVAVASFGIALWGLWPTIVRVSASLSTVLLPAITGAVSALYWSAYAVLGIAGSWVLALGKVAFMFAGWFVSMFLTGLAAVTKGVLMLSAALLTNPITWIVLAIAGAAFLLVKYWGPISEFFRALWADVAGGFTIAWQQIVGIVQGAIATATGLMGTWATVRAFFSRLWGDVAGGAGIAWSQIAAVVQDIGGAAAQSAMQTWGSVRSYFAQLWGDIEGGAGIAWSQIGAVLQVDVPALLARSWSGAPGFFTQLWGDVASRFGAGLSQIERVLRAVPGAGLVIGMWSGVRGFFAGLWDDVVGGAGIAWSQIAAVVQGIGGAAAGSVTETWSAVRGFFAQLWPDVGGVATAGWALIAGVVRIGSTAAVDAVNEVWGGLLDFFDGLWGGIKDGFTTTFDWIMGRVQAVAGFIGSVVSQVASVIPGMKGPGAGSGAPSDVGGTQPSPFGSALALGANTAPRGTSVGSAIGRGAPAEAKVGGSLRIQIDQDGRAKVKELRSDNPDVQLDVYSGNYMVGA